MPTSPSSRVPPAEPTPPAHITPDSYHRYLLKLQAWFSGELLRALYGLAFHLPDNYPLPSLISSYGAEGGKAGGYPSDQMNAIVSYLDKQKRYDVPLRDTFKTLCSERPEVARALWHRHIMLATVREISIKEDVSERTVKYRLAYGNGEIFATFTRVALNHRRQLYAIASSSQFLLADLLFVLRKGKEKNLCEEDLFDILALSGCEESTYIE